MARSSAAAKVGVVVIAAAALFAAVTWFFMGRNIGGYPLNVSFRDALGTQEGADVRLAGVKIGTVRDIDVDSTGRRAILHLSIFSNRRIPEDSSFTLTSGGLLGEMFVQVTPPKGTGRQGFLPVNAKPVPNVVGTDLPTFDELKVKVAELGDGANNVLTSMARVSQRLETLAKDPMLENSLKRTGANMAVASEQAALAAQRVNSVIEREIPTLHAMVKDVKSTTAGLPAAGHNVKQITDNVNRLVKRIDETVVFLRTSVQDTVDETELKPSLKTTMDNIARASSEFEGIAVDARKISADLASKGEATSRIGELVTSIQQVAEKANTLLNRISGVADKAGSARVPSVTIAPQFETYQSFGSSPRFRADVGLVIPRSKEASILVGLRDAGESNKFNLQDVTSPSPGLQVRYGLHSSRLGVGLDYMFRHPPVVPGMPQLKGGKGISLDLYSPNNLQVDIMGHQQLNDNTGIAIGLQDILHRTHPTIGLTYRK